MQTQSNDDGGDDGDDGDCCGRIARKRKKHSIREYSFDIDFSEIYKLHSNIFSYSKERLPTIEELKTMKGYITTTFEDENTNTSSRKEVISGYLLYSISDIQLYLTKANKTPFSVNDDRTLYLDYIGVNPLYQGQGIGRILMNTFLDFTSRMRFTSILDVEKDTPHTNTLVSWYTKNGFYVFLEHEEENIDLVCMIRLFC